MNYSGDNHQSFSNKGNIPLSGGIFLIFPIIFFYSNDLILVSFFSIIFLIGFFSDRKILISPKRRFIIQFITILTFVIIADLKILSSRIDLFDIMLSNQVFAYFFSTFCLLILVNGSNFIDGLNGLLISYSLLVIYILGFLGLISDQIISDQNFDLILWLMLLVLFLNILSELEFFKNENVELSFTLFLSVLNSPTQIFELFPFILLLTIQLFFIKIFEHREIEIFKYSGLKNSKLMTILAILSMITGILVITLFYNFSSSLKNIYLELKSVYTSDGKYLAVITKNGLWIKDKIENKIIITNSSSINDNFLINSFITEFDNKFNVIRNIQSDKIDISENNWKILKAKIYKENDSSSESILNLNTNFDVNRIQTLYSNLSALNFIKLYELKLNYKKLNYSTTDVDMYLLKLISYPLYLLFISIFSSLIMLNIKQIRGSTFKILIGLFFSVIIYYLNNFSYVLGSTERISISASIFLPLAILLTTNLIMLNKINEK